MRDIRKNNSHLKVWMNSIVIVCVLAGLLFAQTKWDLSSFAQPSGSFSWRKIASSYYPAVLMGDWRCKIGPEAQLFVDDYLIHSAQGLKRTLHQPVKYKGNPIMKAEKPWEIKLPRMGSFTNIVAANGTILKDPNTGLWRMYYSAVFRRKCLAMSDDLTHWQRPELNLVEFEGSKANNIVFEDMNSDSLSIIYDHKETNPAKKWKAALYHYDDNNPYPAAIYAYFSSDGIHWEKLSNPIMNSYSYGWRGNIKSWAGAWPMPGIGDVVACAWDCKLNKFIAHVKLGTFREGKFFRSRGMCESDDFIHWSEPRITILPDGDDPDDLHLYGNTGWPYESMWLGTLRTYHEEAGNVDFQLISSRDGRHWSRSADRKIFLPNGPTGSYDQGYHTEFTNPPILVGDELWFFYGSTTTAGKKEKSKWHGSINLAKLRKDGFVSLDAGKGEGWVVTRPLLFEGGHIFVNADAQGGEIRVEALEFEFTKPPCPPLKTIAGYEKDNCLPVTGNGYKMPVRWKDNSDLSRLTGKHVRLRFYLKNAKLYSFTIK
jgi:hypothetical protein